MVLGVSEEEEVHAALWEVVRAGPIFRLDGAYVFLHDRVQEATYALIPDAERAAAHLRIGSVLASRTAPEELEEKIFEIVNQLDRGAALIHSPIASRGMIARRNRAWRWSSNACIQTTSPSSRRRSRGPHATARTWILNTAS